MKEEKLEKSIEKISAAAAILSLTEIGLGSLLHSFKIPFSGHFLSLNQALILGKTQLSIKHSNYSKICPSQISLISSLLKSLSPAGKKLTPMLAISTQGLLFNFGTLLFGINPIGVWVGTTLLCLWGFIQPIGIYVLLFGENLLFMARYFLKKFSVFTNITTNDVWTILFILIGVKITLGTFVSVLIFTLEKDKYHSWQNKLIKNAEGKKSRLSQQFQAQGFKSSIKSAIRDVLNPLFLITWSFTVIFFLYAKSTHSSTIWILCRPVIIGFLLFLTVRLIPMHNLYSFLQKCGFNNFSKILKSSIDKLKKL